MTHIRLAPLTIGFALVAATLLAVAAPAHAQTGQAPTSVSIAITPYDTPIKPLSGFASIPVNIQYSYTAGVSTVPTAIEVIVSEAPPWATVSVSPSTVFVNVLEGQTAGAQVNTAPTSQPKLLVSTTADAPAFTPANIKLTVNAKENGDLKASTASDQTLITADFFSIVDAQAATTIQIARPQTQVTYPITVQNLGNANTKLFFEITAKPDGWQVQEPIPITLEAKQQGGKQTTSTVNLNILTPYRNGYLNEVGAITMKVTSNYALDSKTKGDATQVSVLTTTRGFYVPGFETLAAIGAVGALAVAIRRRG